jgi:hypothetical protein
MKTLAIATTLCLLAVSGLIMLIAAMPSPPPSCRDDWKLCKDNSDMVNNSRAWQTAQVACRSRANEQARYGTPEWPTFFFSHYYPKIPYSTGIAVLIEPKAKFQNGYGAMAHTQVVCWYDLNTEKVINVEM